MSAVIPDLWPSTFGEMRETPLRILREQAHFLTEKTGGALIGEVRTDYISQTMFRHTLLVRAPDLNNYRFDLLSIEHPPALYPVKIFNTPLVNEGFHVENQQEFITVLGHVLSAPQTVQIMNALMSQIKVTAS